MVGEGRGLALVAVNLRALDPVHRIAAGDRVAVEQMIEQAGQGREFTPLGGPGQAALLELAAPGEDVGAGHFAKLLGGVQADKLAEILDVALVGAAGARVGQVGEPFDGGRDRGQALELGGGQPACRGD
ncbi:hypothetical protein D3C73_795100 [compost metagenome]